MFGLLVITEKDIAPPFLSDVLRNKQVLLCFWTGLLGVWSEDKRAGVQTGGPWFSLKKGLEQAKEGSLSLRYCHEVCCC